MTTTEAPLYVQGLYIRDFKGVSQIDIVPSDYVITFAGENGEGKSSGLDALWSALMWAAASKDIPDVIANGKDEATVRVDLGEYVVTRVWTRDGDRTKTTIEVRDSKGKVLKHTKRVLAEIVGKISLDPTAFGRLRPSEQRDAVIQFVAPQLPFVLVDHDTERAKLAEERLVAGQDSRRLESHHVEMGKTPAGVPTEEVSTKALSEELALAVDIHANVKTVHRDVELGAEAIRSANDHIVAAKAALGSAEEGLAEANTKAAAAAARVAKMNEKLPNGAPNLDEIRERIDSAKGTNEEVRDAKARVAAGTSAAKARAHWKELCDAVEQWVFDLCSRKRDWTMTIPVALNRDPDVLICELVRRNNCECVHFYFGNEEGRQLWNNPTPLGGPKVSTRPCRQTIPVTVCSDTTSYPSNSSIGTC